MFDQELKVRWFVRLLLVTKQSREIRFPRLDSIAWLPVYHKFRHQNPVRPPDFQDMVGDSTGRLPRQVDEPNLINEDPGTDPSGSWLSQTETLRRHF